MDDFYTIYILACVLLLPVLIWTLIVQYRVKSTFSRYSTVYASSGMTAAEAARTILERAGVYGVAIDRINGTLTDNYDPKTNTVYLSESVYGSSSVAAICIAAHEVGHAIQHNTGYLPVKVRTALVPIVNLGSRLALPILLLGVVLDFLVASTAFTGIGTYISIVGVALYALSTLFMLVTLPTEYNASRRAKKLLTEYGILTREEAMDGANVLSAAAKTYLASFAVSLLSLIRIAFIFLGGRRRR